MKKVRENVTSSADATLDKKQLAINGGVPVRTTPLALEFPGIHYMDEKEVTAALRVLRSRSPFRYYGLDLQGEAEAFESEFASFLGIAHALAVTSGTAALHVALVALGMGPGQEVIVPAYMWVSVVAAVVNLGAIPILADIDETFCLDPTDVQRRITPRTTGIVAVHMSGAQADVYALSKIAREYGLILLEDCAQCMATFSFQMNKNMTSGEGGCVVTNNERLYQRAFACHDTGYARDHSGRAICEDLDLCLCGRGYRLDELRASILRVQLTKLPQVIASMHRSKYRIRRALEVYPDVRLRRIVDREGDTGSFLISTYKDSQTAKSISDALRAEGIVTSPQGVNNVVMTDWGLHIYSNIPSLTNKTSTDQRGFPWRLSENQDSKSTYRKGECPVADNLFSRSILLAIPSCLTEQDEDDIIRAFRKVLDHFAKC